MKTVILAGLDNLVFSAVDMINPEDNRIVGIATEIREAWNVYDENGEIKASIDELPIMPLAAAVEFEPDTIITVAASEDDEKALTHLVIRTGYRGEVMSLFSLSKTISLKTAAIRRLSRRLDELGVEGAAADLGAWYGDISWQINAMMPDRKLYLFDTFSGYDRRDTDIEKEKGLSKAQSGDYAPTEYGKEHFRDRLMSRLPHPEKVDIREGWFPETAYDLEDEKYAFVHIDTGLYQPTYSGIQYFFPRMNRGGVILVSGYTDGKTQSVYRAVRDLEEKYGAFLIIPLSDEEGSIVIVKP